MPETIVGSTLIRLEQKNRLTCRWFGVVTGIAAGAAAFWSCCWFVGRLDVSATALFAGAFVGAVVGFIVGSYYGVHHAKRGGPDVASAIVSGFGIVPGILVLTSALGLVHGRVSGFMAVGAACAFPMAGMLIGGVLDRLYERWFWAELNAAEKSLRDNVK